MGDQVEVAGSEVTPGTEGSDEALMLVGKICVIGKEGDFALGSWAIGVGSKSFPAWGSAES